MNREIKFRAWDKEKNIWLIKTLDELLQWSADGSFQERNMEFVEWQQYTGLKDKNGVEIYEGDILLGRFNVDDVENHIWLQLTDKEKKEQQKIFIVDDIFYLYTNQTPGDLEVIGNIYENPGLLTNKN